MLNRRGVAQDDRIARTSCNVLLDAAALWILSFYKFVPARFLGQDVPVGISSPITLRSF